MKHLNWFYSVLTRKGKTGRSGQAMVEFALVLPILLLLIMGIIEFGRLLFIYSAVTTSSREAARYASASGLPSGFSTSSDVERYEDCAGIRAAARRSAIAINLADSDILISYDHGPGTTVYSSTCPPSGGFTLGDRVNVQVSYTYHPLVPIVQFPDIPITAESARTILKDIPIAGASATGSSTTPKLYFLTNASAADSRNEDAGTFTISVMLSAPTDVAVTAPVYASGSASGADYTVAPTSISIAPGAVSADIVVTIIDDTIDEYDETVVLSLGTPSNAELGSPDVFTLTILDNDEPPLVKFALSTSEVLEGLNAPTGTALIQVGLWDSSTSGPTVSGKDVTVSFTLGGDATLGSDYTLDSIFVTIPAGNQFVFYIVRLVDDTVDEPDEKLILTMDSPQNASLGNPAEHTLTILDDDVVSVSFEIAATSAPEAIGTVQITVKLLATSTQPLAVPFTIRATSTALAGADYVLLTAGVVNFPAGTDTAVIQVSLVNDAFDESDETVIFDLSAGVGYELGSIPSHTLNIVGTAAKPKISFAAAAVSHDENVASLVVKVEIEEASIWTLDIEVPYTINGAGTASNGGVDYTFSDGSVTIPAGSNFATFSIPIVNDLMDEPGETIVLNMGMPIDADQGSVIKTTLTIIDDDAGPDIYFESIGQSVGEDVGSVLVKVKLSQISAFPVTVGFTTIPTSTAVLDTDYSYATATPLSIPAGEQFATIVVNVIDNLTPDQNPRTVDIQLASPTNATLGTPEHFLLTIRENEICPEIRASSRTTSGAPGKITLSVANDLPDAKDVYITEIRVTFSAPGGQKMEEIVWDGSSVFSGNTGSPATVTGLATWQHLIPGFSYQMVLTFNKELSGTMSVRITFSNQCVRSSTSN